MRIWHVYASDRLGPVNGVVQAISQLAAAQRSIGMEVSVLHGTDDDPRRGPAYGRALGLRRQARALAATAPPDLIHLHELFRPPHLSLAPMLRSTPYVVSTHGAVSTQNLARYRVRKAAYGALVERRLVGGADALFALTQVERSEFQAWLPHGPPIAVVPNAADAELLATPAWSPGSSALPHEVVSLARWDVRHKGLDRVAELARALPDTAFRIHGGRCGNEPELLDRLRAEAPPNLTFAAPVHGTDKRDLLRSVRAFLLLSRWEGLSMALLEAMALGVPCLVSPEVAMTIGSRPPVITIDDWRDGTGAVHAALADDELLTRVGSAARRWVADHAAPEVVARAIATHYQQVLDASETGAHRRVPSSVRS